MQSIDHFVTLHVSVWDKRAVLKAARAKAKADGVPASTITNYRDALRWLLDPGALPGVSIDDSSID